MDEGWTQGAVVEGPAEVFVHKGGYLYSPGNNGMQTQKARTIKPHFGGDEEAARQIIMQSTDIIHSEDCMTLCLSTC